MIAKMICWVRDAEKQRCALGFHDQQKETTSFIELHSLNMIWTFCPGLPTSIGISYSTSIKIPMTLKHVSRLALLW